MNHTSDEHAASGGRCARCQAPAGPEGRRWHFHRHEANRMVMVWLCAACVAQRKPDRCVLCEERVALASVPLCVECLISYEVAPRKTA